MATNQQLLTGLRKLRKTKDKRPALFSCPQKFGICWRVGTVTPRKPNSAIRKIARVKLPILNVMLTAYIPGIGHTLHKYSTVLVRGGRTNDLPGLKYKLIRGKHDFAGVLNRRTSRSKYGLKRLVRND